MTEVLTYSLEITDSYKDSYKVDDFEFLMGYIVPWLLIRGGQRSIPPPPTNTHLLGSFSWEGREGEEEKRRGFNNSEKSKREEKRLGKKKKGRKGGKGYIKEKWLSQKY